MDAYGQLEKIITQRLSKAEMVGYLKNYPEQMELVTTMAISDQVPHGWRACWMLFHSTDPDDQRLQPYIHALINAIEGKQEGHQRELIKLVTRMNLNDEQEGLLFDRCMCIWESVKKIPSLRVSAFRFLMQVVKKYPELKAEILHVMSNEYLETLSPGIRRSIEKQLEKALK